MQDAVTTAHLFHSTLNATYFGHVMTCIVPSPSPQKIRNSSPFFLTWGKYRETTASHENDRLFTIAQHLDPVMSEQQLQEDILLCTEAK